MDTLHHKAIKRFFLDGTIVDDVHIARLKSEYIQILQDGMRVCGYVPRLDLDPDFTIEYNVDRNVFNFALSIYGIYAGKKKSEWILGIDGTQVIPIRQSKSEELSRDLA